jgi:hypothetical protein
MPVKMENRIVLAGSLSIHAALAAVKASEEHGSSPTKGDTKGLGTKSAWVQSIAGAISSLPVSTKYQ